MFPAVLVSAFIEQYVAQVDKSQLMGKLKRQLTYKCIVEFNLAPWESLIIRMLSIIDKPNDMLMKQYELVNFGITQRMKHHEWLEYLKNEHNGLEGLDWVNRGSEYPEHSRGIHITPKFFQKIATNSFDGATFINTFIWIEAIYSGLKLFEILIKLDIIQAEKNDILLAITDSYEV